MATITGDDIQRWLEDMADRWMAHPDATPVLLPGITEVGVRLPLSQRYLSEMAAQGILYEHVKMPDREFYAIWCGQEFTTRRVP